MNDNTTTYLVHVTTASPEGAGFVMQAAAERGYTNIRFSAVDGGGRRPVNRDELGLILKAATGARWPADSEGIADGVIKALVEQLGREDWARAVYGDERVDEWFRAQNIDPQAARDDG
jgi:hypothetical protein